MKSIVTAIGFFALTAAAIIFYPHTSVHGTAVKHVAPLKTGISLIQPVEKPRIEVVFVLDTTGSMGGVIAASKEKIWSIAITMANANEAPEVRMGLVAYRDRGDAYVTRVVDLSPDLDAMYSTMGGIEIAGEEEPFSLWAGISAAFATIPVNLSESLGMWADPLGVNIGPVADTEQRVDVVRDHHDGQIQIGMKIVD